jgi:hypothetical protein
MMRPFARKWLCVPALCGAALLAGCEREAPPAPAPPPTPTTTLPALPLKYSLVRAIAAGVARPRGIALDAAGRLYVAGAQLRVLNPDFTEALRVELQGDAGCVAVDAGGDIYLGMKSGPDGLGPHVRKYDAGGKLVASWGKAGRGPGELAIPTGIALRKGQLCVADPGNRCIHLFDPTGDFIDDLGKRGGGDPGIVCPSPFLDCAADARGTLLVPNPGVWRVESYSLAGARTGAWGEGGVKPHQFPGCCNPTNIAVMADGKIVLSEKRGPKLKVYSPAGALLAYAGGELFHPDAAGIDLACDAKGRIYALDPAAEKVLLLEATASAPAAGK